MNRSPRVGILLAIALLLGAIPSYSRTWHVKQDGTGDATTIDGGFYYTSPGDTILVGPGTYCQPPIRLEQVHLISEQGPEVTILQLCPYAMEDVQVIIIEDVPGPCSVIGFTIAGARNGYLNAGGGIRCARSGAIIKGNIIMDNWCSSGGGLACDGSPAPIVENNLFHMNGAVAGAAIEIYDCSPIIISNTVTNNWASDGAGAIVIFGNNSYPVISNNVIVDNQCNSDAKGAIDCFTPAEQVAFSCNDVWGNHPSNYDGTMSDQTGLNGNISLDPLFCGILRSGNYYLQEGSPCEEGNGPAACGESRMGCYQVKCTVGIEHESWGKIKGLYEGGGRK
jgi:hypothetical protein